MLLLVALIVFIGFYIGFIFSKDQSSKRKYIVWGLVTIFIFTPFLGWTISIAVALYVRDGFAGVGMMMFLLPTFFIIGLILTLIGIFKKSVITTQIE